MEGSQLRDEEAVLALLRRVARRRAANRIAQGVVDASAAAFVSFALLRPLAILLPVPQLLQAGLPLAIGLALFGWRIAGCHPSLEAAAALADRSADLRDELKTAVSLAAGGPTSPWSRLQLRRAAVTAERLEARRIEPAVRPQRLGALTAALLAAVAALVLPVSTLRPGLLAEARATSDPAPDPVTDPTLGPPQIVPERVRLLRLPWLGRDSQPFGTRRPEPGSTSTDGASGESEAGAAEAGADSERSSATEREGAESGGAADPTAPTGTEATSAETGSRQSADPASERGTSSSTAAGSSDNRRAARTDDPNAVGSGQFYPSDASEDGSQSPERDAGAAGALIDGELAVDGGESGLPAGASTGPQRGDSLTLAEAATELGAELRSELSVDLALGVSTGELPEDEAGRRLPTPSRRQPAELPLRSVPLRTDWDREAALPHPRLAPADRELVRRYFLARAAEEP